MALRVILDQILAAIIGGWETAHADPTLNVISQVDPFQNSAGTANLCALQIFVGQPKGVTTVSGFAELWCQGQFENVYMLDVRKGKESAFNHPIVGDITIGFSSTDFGQSPLPGAIYLKSDAYHGGAYYNDPANVGLDWLAGVNGPFHFVSTNDCKGKDVNAKVAVFQQNLYPNDYNQDAYYCIALPRKDSSVGCPN